MPDYFTLEELRALPDMDDEERYPDELVEAAAAYFETAVEREVGQPFVPRTATETLDGHGGLALVLSRSNVRTLTSVTVDGTAVDVADLSGEYGLLRYTDRATSWLAGIGNVVVTYTYGKYTAAPGDVKDAVMWATRDRLLGQSKQTGSNARRRQVTNDVGGTTTYVLADGQNPTGYPDLDAVIAGRIRSDDIGEFA